ncbi:arylacetamide deacetylase-like 3 [Tiliqua scincoides]|uniref:arylacetamide deacetylase-like 3 n=1 Tax=Tiliqua scincoides TaxID=71010 RepID=UPI003462E721
MGFLWDVLATFAELGAIAGLIQLAWAIHYSLSRTEIPHGVCQPYKVKIIYLLLVLLVSTAKLSIKDLQIQGIPVRLYQPKQAHAARKGVVHIHGGGGSMGSIAAYEMVCRYIADESDSVVLSIGYSLPHQRTHPAQFQECLDVTIHFMNHAKDYGVDPARVIIMGDSFGGLLAASICQMMAQRDNTPKPRAQILIYPCLQFVTFSLPSYMQNASAPPLLRRQVMTFALQYLQKHVSMVDMLVEGSHCSKDLKMKYEKWLSLDNIPEEFKFREKKAPLPTKRFGDILAFIDLISEKTINPLLAEDTIIRQLPELFLVSAQYDVLRDDGILYKKRLEDNGVPVSWCHLEDGFHGVLTLIGDPFLSSSCTKRGMKSVVNYINDL